MNQNQDHFRLFGLPRSFTIDAAALDARYRELQREVHPDRFATGSDAEKRRSIELATQVNEGYRTLKSPLPRARYLLELAGVDIGAETNTAMPADFLMEQMEWREGLEEADRAGDTCGLNRLDLQLNGERDKAHAALAAAFEGKQLQAAAQVVRKLMFLERFREDVADTRDRYAV
jgi:molecular chaperone HscB